jgi:uncharacterized protein (DUF1330 family)
VTTTAHIDPSHDQIEALIAAAQSDDSPIVMVNLLAFRAAGGRESYLRYAAEVQPHLDRVGGTVLFAGDRAQTVIGDEETAWWDAILLVRYPSRSKFLEMVTDPGYLAIAEYRSNALDTSGLVATTSWLPAG